jgi:hypothetical protein
MQKLDNNRLLTRAVSILAQRLPSQWIVKAAPNGREKSEAHAQIRILASHAAEATLNAVLKQSLAPIDVLKIRDMTTSSSAKIRREVLVVSPFISPSAREKLREHGLGYLDFCGNVWLKLDVPALYIESEGAQKNPSKSDRQARTLKGAKAGLIVRELADTATVPGIRELAKRIGIDPGYVSRVFAFLEDEAIIRRMPLTGVHGRSHASHRRAERRLDWASLIRRWALDAPFESRERILTYIEPRGLKTVLSNLTNVPFQYAITGSFAAAEVAPIAPTRLLQIYVENAEETAAELGLREADSGANVMLVEAETESPFLRSRRKGSLIYASISLVVADLLSSPGRSPAEAEELIAWMKNNEEVWRG